MNIHSASRLISSQKMPSAKYALRLAGWCVLILFALTQARPAHAVVHSNILINAQTGQVLHEYHPDERAHPASLTKLMTLYITFQRLEQGRLTLNQRLHVSPYAAAQQPSKMGLRAGSTISVRSCILGIISHSANDAAVVLAENIAGSESRFAQIMNQQARQLGMTHTVFYNASGLPNNRQWTTARDMATLALSLIQTFPQYYHYFDTHSFDYHGRMLYSFDHLPEIYRGADGMKTGYIYSSGFNIVTSAVRDHHRLIGVIFGGRTARSRDIEMVSLLNRGFRTFSQNQNLVAANRPQVEHHAPVHIRPVSHHAVRTTLVAENVDPQPAAGNHRVIQIGMQFRSSHDVRRILHSARLSAPSLRHHGHGIVVLLRNRRYLARFTNLSFNDALQACTSLREKRYTCTILKSFPGRSQNLAANRDGRLLRNR